MLQQWNNMKNIWLYVFLSFPLLDYILRNWLPIPVIPSLWDEGVIFVLMLYIFLQFKGKFSKEDFPETIFYPFVAFIVLGISHLIIDLPNFAATLEGFRAVYQYMIALFIGMFLITKQEDGIKMLRFITIIGTSAAIVGLLQVILGVETPASWIDASEQGLTRAFSFVVSPNVLGSYMILVGPMALGFLLYEKNKVWKLFWAASFIIILLTLVFSGSRGAWLGLFGAIAIVFMFINRKLLIATLVGSISLVMFVPMIRSRMLNLFSMEYFEKSSNDGRIGRWLDAFHIMQKDPFFGRGLGHYGGAVGDRYFGTIYVDSYYFKTIAETGIIGMMIYAWLIIATFIFLYKKWKLWKGSTEFYLLGGVFIGLLSVILHNGVENIFEVPFMNSYFWFLVGLLLAFSSLKKGDHHESKHE